jgi:DNA-binding transcriptional LysR family regulator
VSFLENVQTFVRVIDLGGMSAAARQLRLSPAVISHRLQQLESHLGVRLLNRTTRALQLTEPGAAFYEACQDVLRAVEQAEGVAFEAGGIPSGNIRLSAPLGLGRRLVAPLLPEFCAMHSRLTIRLRLSDYLLDLVREAVDLSVRLAVLGDSSLIARKIADCPRILCAAPGYLEEHGTPRVPDDLFQHECLLLRFPGSQQYRWTLQKPSGPVTLHLRGRLDADDGDVLTAWALDGRGITLKPVFEVAAHLKSGALRPVLLDAPPPPATLAVVYPHRRLLPSKVRLLSDFLVAELGPAVEREVAGLDVPALA